MNKYKLIAICGKSAAGKDTFLREMAKLENLHEVVSCTTRPPREGEINGINYHFLTTAEFVKKIDNKEMLEASIFRDWYYGTSYDGLDKNKINVGVFNPDGIRYMMNIDNLDLYVVLVIASDKIRLLRSLNREENPDVDEIVRRYTTDKNDFESFSQFYEPDYTVENNGQGIDPARARDIAERIVEEAERAWAKKANQ